MPSINHMHISNLVSILMCNSGYAELSWIRSQNDGVVYPWPTKHEVVSAPSSDDKSLHFKADCRRKKISSEAETSIRSLLIFRGIDLVSDRVSCTNIQTEHVGYFQVKATRDTLHTPHASGFALVYSKLQLR